MKTLFYVHDDQRDPAPRVEALEACGFRVLPFPSGEACVRRLYAERPSAVVLDVLLEGPNGFEVCRDLRSRFSANELPILLLSGIFRSPRFAEEARVCGAQDYLVEPAALEDLVARLLALLGPMRAAVSDTAESSSAV